MLNKRTVKKIEKQVEKRLHKVYKDSAYFYIDRVTTSFGELEGFSDLHCVAGYEITENGQSTGKFHQINFMFGTNDEVVKNINEYIAVLSVYVIGELDDYSAFERKD